MVSQHPTKFGDHRIAVEMFLVVEEQDSSKIPYACLLPPVKFPLKQMACHTLTHEIPDQPNFFITNISQCVQ